MRIRTPMHKGAGIIFAVLIGLDQIPPLAVNWAGAIEVVDLVVLVDDACEVSYSMYKQVESSNVLKP
jgi:hypothetical protein